MKILLGTPINISKDFAIPKWLNIVAKLRKEYPCDFLMVDTSPDNNYLAKIKEYCKKSGINDYKLEHIEIGQWQPMAEKVGRSWEVIRQKCLAFNYDAWFSWECDLFIPTNSLSILTRVMVSGNYSMVHTNVWTTTNPPQPEAKFGCSLVKRDVLEKYKFSLTLPEENCWAAGEERFKKKVIAGGGSFLELYGTIQPVYRLQK